MYTGIGDLFKKVDYDNDYEYEYCRYSFMYKGLSVS